MQNITAANDTQVLDVPVGCTVEAGAWRVHRYSSSVEVTSLTGAGRRGRRCARWTITAGLHDDGHAMGVLAVGLAGVAASGVAVETMRHFCVDAPLTCPGVVVHETHPKGIEVPEPGVVRIDGEWVRGEFSSTEWRLTFSVPLDGVKAKGMRQDSHLFGDRPTARKALAWARQNASRIPEMTRRDVHAALREAGVKVDSHG